MYPSELILQKEVPWTIATQHEKRQTLAEELAEGTQSPCTAAPTPQGAREHAFPEGWGRTSRRSDPPSCAYCLPKRLRLGRAVRGPDAAPGRRAALGWEVCGGPLALPQPDRDCRGLSFPMCKRGCAGQFSGTIPAQSPWACVQPQSPVPAPLYQGAGGTCKSAPGWFICCPPQRTGSRPGRHLRRLCGTFRNVRTRARPPWGSWFLTDRLQQGQDLFCSK